MKIKNGFVLREVGGNVMVLPTGKLMEEFEITIKLNKTGKFIWECLQEDISLDELINKMMDKYKIDEEKARNDAKKFINQLQEAKILE